MIARKLYEAALLAALALGLTSCYKDLSTEADQSIPDISVDSGEIEGVLNLSYGEVLHFAPEVIQEGRTPEDFTYLWMIDVAPGRLRDRIEIGDEAELDYKVGNKPSDQPYYLTLEVTDKKSGISVMKAWKVYVSSSLGEGILVAHTKDGGQHSDLDLLSDKYFTYGFKGSEPRVVRGLYSLANGEPYPGRIYSMTASATSLTSSFGEREILIGADKDFIALDPLTYKIGRKNAELFYMTSEPDFKVTDVFNYAGYVSACILNGRLYGMICNSTNAYNKIHFGKTPDDQFTPEALAYAKPDQGSVCFFDKAHDAFFSIKGWMSGSGGMVALSRKPETFSIAESEPLGGGAFKGNVLAYNVKKNTGGYAMVTLYLDGNEPVLTEYPLSGEGLDQAVCHEFCDNCEVMYYATPETIYANTIIGNEVITRKINWQPDSPDEKITDIVHYKQAWYGTHQYGSEYEFMLPMHQLMMLVVTYNEKTGEGKIYPRQFNVTTGLFTFKEYEPYTGFGEITALTTTFK